MVGNRGTGKQIFWELKVLGNRGPGKRENIGTGKPGPWSVGTGNIDNGTRGPEKYRHWGTGNGKCRYSKP